MDDKTNWVTTREAAQRSGYVAETVRRLANQGRIKSRKFGIVYQIDLEDLLRYKAKQEEKGRGDENPSR
jgi:excisionase family DNA binding protein